MSLEYEGSPRVLISLVRQPRCAAATADGRQQATGHADGSIVLWDVETDRPLRKLAGLTSAVDVLAFHPTEPKLAAAAGDHAIHLWDAETGELLKVLTGHTRRITSICFSPDGRQLLTGGYDKTMRLWSLEAPQEPPFIKEHASAVIAAAFASDGSSFASGTLSGELQLWTREGEALVSPQMRHPGGVRGLLFHPMTHEWITGGGDGQIAISDATTGAQRIRLLEGLQSSSAITRMTLSADGRLLAAGDQNGGIRLWNLENPDNTILLESHQDEICGIAFLENSRSLISTSLDQSVRLWNPLLAPTPRLTSLEQDVPEKLWALAIAPQDAAIYAGGRKGFLASWDLSTGQQIRTFQGFKGTIDALSLSADGSRLACCSWKGKSVVVFHTQTGEKESERTAEKNVRCVRFHPDSQLLAAGLEDGRVIIWANSGSDPRTVAVSSQPIYDISFSPDGQLAAICTGDWRENTPGSVMVWKTQDWTEQRRFSDHTRAVRSVVFSRDGSKLASAGEEGLVVLRDLQSPLPIAKFQNASGTRPLALSPDGTRVAVGLHNRIIAIWDVQRGEIVQRFRAEDDVFGLAYTSDGTVLTSVSGEQRMEFWPGMEQSSAASRIQRWDRDPN